MLCLCLCACVLVLVSLKIPTVHGYMSFLSLSLSLSLSLLILSLSLSPSLSLSFDPLCVSVLDETTSNIRPQQMARSSAWRRRFSKHENLTYQALNRFGARHFGVEVNKGKGGVVSRWNLHRGDSLKHSSPVSHHCRWQPVLLALLPA